MRAPIFILASLLLASGVFAADENGPNQDQRVGEGLMLIIKGEKEKAWQVLFPEAKAGNVVAMFHLGNMMLKSPEYPDNLERAYKFFSAAAAKGHQGSKALLAQVQQALDAKKSGVPTGIAGFSGVATDQEKRDAQARLEKYQSEVLRYTGAVSQLAPKVDVKFFLRDTDSTTEQIYAISESVKQQFGDSIKINLFIIVDPSAWQPNKPETSPVSKMPPSAFEPDFGGTLAAEYGVRQTPAIVLTPEKGRPQVISDPRSLVADISRLLK